MQCTQWALSEHTVQSTQWAHSVLLCSPHSEQKPLNFPLKPVSAWQWERQAKGFEIYKSRNCATARHKCADCMQSTSNCNTNFTTLFHLKILSRLKTYLMDMYFWSSHEANMTGLVKGPNELLWERLSCRTVESFYNSSNGCLCLIKFTSKSINF